MMLFVVDQVAGAEYIVPLLNKWKREGRHNWKVLASPQSSACLKSNDVAHDVLQNCDDKEATSWIERVLPDRALVSTSVDSSIEYCFVRALKEKKIPSSQLIDNWVNFSRRFQFIDASGAQFMQLPDWILTLDETARRRMVAEGLPEDRIKIIGQPHWEASLQKSRAEPVEPESGLALIVTQPISRFFGKELGYDEMDFVRCCLKSWESLGFDWNRLHLLIHPSESRSAYYDLLKENNGKVVIAEKSGLRLGRYSLVMGMFSSLLNQCLLERISAVSVQPGAVGEDRCFLSEMGFIPRLHSSEQLTHYLQLMWTASDRTSENADRFEAIVDGSLARLEEFLEHNLT